MKHNADALNADAPDAAYTYSLSNKKNNKNNMTTNTYAPDIYAPQCC